MTIIVALGMVLVAIVLLSIDRIPIEVSSLAIVVLLVVSGLATPRQALSGFSSETVIFIFALLALTQGLRATGVMQLVGRRMLFYARSSSRAFVVMMLVTVCAVSSVASNTAVTATFLPVIMTASGRAGVSSRQLLMPVAFSSMLGGTIFLFGTSTNLVVSAAMEDLGLGRIGFAELAPVGLALATVGLATTSFLARRLLPARTNRDETATSHERIESEHPSYRRAVLAVVIFAGTVVAAGLRVTSPAIVGLAGVLAMVVTGCMDSRTAFRVDWRVILMVGALLTLGQAVERSGAGAFLARGIVPLAGLLGPRGVLGAVMLGTILLSIPMSNQAAALLMLPVGIHVALEMGLEPRTFAVGTCLAASCAFLTPLEPSAALVYGPGRYRFSDFLRVGGPLTLMMLLLLTLAVPLVWPFSAR